MIHGKIIDIERVRQQIIRSECLCLHINCTREKIINGCAGTLRETWQLHLFDSRGI